MAFLDLFRPKWKHSNPEIRISSVKKIKKSRRLKEIIENDSDERVKQVAWFQIAKNDKWGSEGIYAVKSLEDQKLLADIAKNEGKEYLRTAAVKKLEDWEVLDYIAKNDEDNDVRLAAIEKVVIKITKADNFIAAVEKLEDQKLLADIAKNCKRVHVRRPAVEKLDPQKWQDLLAEIAKNDEDPLVCIAAVKKLNDQKVLAYVAKNDKKYFVRTAAVEKLNDQKLLTDIAKNDENEYVRQAAVKKLNDQKLLSDIARNDENEDVRQAAVEKVKDRKLLAEIAKEEIEFKWKKKKERIIIPEKRRPILRCCTREDYLSLSIEDGGQLLFDFLELIEKKYPREEFGYYSFPGLIYDEMVFSSLFSELKAACFIKSTGLERFRLTKYD